MSHHCCKKRPVLILNTNGVQGPQGPSGEGVQGPQGPSGTTEFFTSILAPPCDGRQVNVLGPIPLVPDIDIVVHTIGRGAIMRTIPSDGGNCRGAYAVDWQSDRTSPVQVASGEGSVIGGGRANTASGESSTVAGGLNNIANGQESTIAGGAYNTIDTKLATIGGGLRNKSSNLETVIGGGSQNETNGLGAVIVGGNRNTANGQRSSIGGGESNSANAEYSSIGGGSQNRANGPWSSIGGGFDNMANGGDSVVAGGYNNIANADRSSICGGFVNAITLGSTYATIAGGSNNTISGSYAGSLAGQGLNLTFPHSSAVGRYNLPGTLGTERLFMVGYGTSAGNRSNLFSVTLEGNAHVAGIVVTSGADFAELYESIDGKAIPVGTSVVFVEGTPKIRPARPDELPIGVISNSAAFMANAAEEEWVGKYERDARGQYIWELHQEKKQVPETIKQKILRRREQVDYDQTPPEITIIEEELEVEIPVMTEAVVKDAQGQLLGRRMIPQLKEVMETSHRKKLSPHYDPSRKYVPRTARPEWNIVGLMGAVKILKGSPVRPDWLKLETGVDYDLWLIK